MNSTDRILRNICVQGYHNIYIYIYIRYMFNNIIIILLHKFEHSWVAAM